MAQFRLTQKFSRDCNIEKLVCPIQALHPLDDWFFDRIIAYRKKIAMITHAKTQFTFFIPYAEAGGAKNMFSYFERELLRLLNQCNRGEMGVEVKKLFELPPVFCKTGACKCECKQPLYQYPGCTRRK